MIRLAIIVFVVVVCLIRFVPMLLELKRKCQTTYTKRILSLLPMWRAHQHLTKENLHKHEKQVAPALAVFVEDSDEVDSCSSHSSVFTVPALTAIVEDSDEVKSCSSHSSVSTEPELTVVVEDGLAYTETTMFMWA